MNRRNFLKNSSLAGLTITSLAAASCNTAAPKVKEPDNEETSSSSEEEFELNEATIDELQQKMKDGTYTVM